MFSKPFLSQLFIGKLFLKTVLETVLETGHLLKEYYLRETKRLKENVLQ
jgi:hypothetical protein